MNAIGDADTKNAGHDELLAAARVDANGTPAASGVESKGTGSKRSKKKG